MEEKAVAEQYSPRKVHILIPRILNLCTLPYMGRMSERGSIAGLKDR